MRPTKRSSPLWQSCFYTQLLLMGNFSSFSFLQKLLLPKPGGNSSLEIHELLKVHLKRLSLSTHAEKSFSLSRSLKAESHRHLKRGASRADQTHAESVFSSQASSPDTLGFSSAE